MAETIANLASLAVLVVNLVALGALAFGLLRPEASTVSRALKVSVACSVIALVLFFVMPAIHAAEMRANMAKWSPEERGLVEKNVQNVEVDPIYDVSLLFKTIHFFPLPILAALLLRYRFVRIQREGQKFVEAEPRRTS